MITIKNFVFNPFQVNTYLIFDENKECIIIDAACSNEAEENKLFNFIEDNKLTPRLLISTHAHIDHIIGNKAIIEKYHIPYRIHHAGTPFLENAVAYGASFGLNVNPSPQPNSFINENEDITCGNINIKALYVPGHADGSICYYESNEGYLFSGDVLFSCGIGRTDLPTGNYDLLISGITNKLFNLPKDTKVYPGHGHETSIGYEIDNNPFF